MILCFFMFLFIVSLQPLEMIGVLLVMVGAGSLCMYYVMGSFWYSYLLMMVVISGILIVFVYMASLVPNERYEFFGVSFAFLLSLGIVFIEVDSEFGVVSSFLSVKLWEDMTFFFNLFMVSFLLVIMIIVVYMSWIGYGPVRVM